MKYITAVLIMLLMLIACNKNDSTVKYSYSYNSDGEVEREMILKNALSDKEIKMTGTATFSKDLTLITAMTEGGYINYKNKDVLLNVISDNSKVTIFMKKGNQKISNTSDTGKEIIAEAIRDIKKLQDKYK